MVANKVIVTFKITVASGFNDLSKQDIFALSSSKYNLVASLEGSFAEGEELWHVALLAGGGEGAAAREVVATASGPFRWSKGVAVAALEAGTLCASKGIFGKFLSAGVTTSASRAWRATNQILGLCW